MTKLTRDSVGVRERERETDKAERWMWCSRCDRILTRVLTAVLLKWKSSKTVMER